MAEGSDMNADDKKKKRERQDEPKTAAARAIRAAALEEERRLRAVEIEKKRLEGTLRPPSRNRKRKKHGRR